MFKLLRNWLSTFQLHHTFNNWQDWDLDPGSLGPESMPWTIISLLLKAAITILTVFRLIRFPPLTWHHHSTYMLGDSLFFPNFLSLSWNLLKMYLLALPDLGSRRHGGYPLWLDGFCCSSACFPLTPSYPVLTSNTPFGDKGRNKRANIQSTSVLWRFIICLSDNINYWKCKLCLTPCVNYKTWWLMAFFFFKTKCLTENKWSTQLLKVSTEHSFEVLR